MSKPAREPTLLPQEIEAKFLLDDVAAAEEFLAKPPFATHFVAGPIRGVTTTDVYLDTADFRCLRLGYGLRVRTVEQRRLVALKSRALGEQLANGVVQRSELEVALPDAASLHSLEGWPAEMVASLAPILGAEAQFQALCVIQQERRKCLVYPKPAPGQKPAVPSSAPAPEKANALAEYSIDRVTVEQANAEPQALPVTWCELEVEAAATGDSAAFSALVEAVRRAVPVRPSAASKLEQALTRLHAAEANGRIQPCTPMAEACRALWREQLLLMLAEEAGVRFSADPEYVHQMRVATRRARAAARLYAAFFRPKAIRHYLKGLQQTARLLGAVRDLDVAIEKLERFQAKGKDKSVAGLAPILAQWQAQRTTAHAALLTWLDSPHYGQFVGDFAAFCRTPGRGAQKLVVVPGEAPPRVQVRHVTPGMIWGHFEHVRGFETLFEAHAEIPVETLHQLRIECKYLRYNLEFMHGALGSPVEPLLAALRRLQDRLGDLNDAAVSRQMVVAAGVPLQPLGVQRYLLAQANRIERQRKRVATEFLSFTAPRNRRRLAAAVATP